MFFCLVGVATKWKNLVLSILFVGTLNVSWCIEQCVLFDYVGRNLIDP